MECFPNVYIYCRQFIDFMALQPIIDIYDKATDMVDGSACSSAAAQASRGVSPASQRQAAVCRGRMLSIHFVY